MNMTSAPMGADIYPQLSWFSQERVAQARVLVVGAGALGNEVLKDLVLFGVEHITLVDFDRVESSNLSRSVLFTRQDAEERIYKVDAAARRLREMNPRLEVRTLKGDIAHCIGIGELRQIDVAIGCLDNRYARYCLNRLCMRAGIPWVDGGIDSLEGTARVFAPGKNCYACNLGTEGQREMRCRMSCAGTIRRNEEAGRAPTTPVTASVIAAVQVQEAMKIIHSEEIRKGTFTSLCGKMFYYDGQHLTTKLLSFAAWDDDCPMHDEWTPTASVPLDVSTTTVGEALHIIKEALHARDVSISLRDYAFVDYVVHRRTDRRHDLLLPSFLVPAAIESHPELSRHPDSDFLAHEIRRLDTNFPYPDLTLEQVGIPPDDILHCITPSLREEYVLLAALTRT